MESRELNLRIGLCDRQTYPLIAREDARQDAIDELLLTILDKRRTPNSKASDQVPHQTAGASPGQLVCEEHLVEQIPFLHRHALDGILDQVSRVLHAQKASQVAPFSHLFVDLIRDLFGLIPFGYVGVDLAFDPFSNLGSQSGMCFVVVG